MSNLRFDLLETCLFHNFETRTKFMRDVIKIEIMKTLLLTIFTTVISAVIFGQDYSPLRKGSKKTFQMKNASYTNEVLKKTIIVNAIEYYQSVTTYSWGSTDNIKLRIDSLGNELYLDPTSNTESINFPTSPQKDFSWISTDGAWKYEIFDIGPTFSSPSKTYKNCLIIKAKQITGRDKSKLQIYYNYYAEGIGYIGSKTPEGIMSWMTKFKPGK